MFATDTPLIEWTMSNKEWVEMIKHLPDNSTKGVTFTEEEGSALLDGNVRRLFSTIRQ